ncbi:MAG TPA: hypothetical protein VGS97_19475 [Actinocrinis sp.]|uniref:hypothetical protein n=1 Tax=Actinocrinis sp. TaxID=1920516 RepID=UPI002DDD7849|nr:hypothetical protein [Actinocrinis sp.]HEV2346289.1 hypothetical protein [Actinocrinis sp.]
MTDWRTPGPDRPTDPRDELVQALLGLRWALPRTDADARVALDQLSTVASRVSQLAGEQSGDETPWDGQVQALLAQAGFALDWWRPVLDDVDLDWTLNHQAHLSADLARIASAGARILDQFAPAVPNPAAAPPSAVTEGPPQHTHAPRVAAAFGSVPATAIVDPLANSGRHRRPAYEFESFDAPGAGPQAPVEHELPSNQPGPTFTPPAHVPPQHQAPPQLPDDLEPELEQLFRPQEPPRAATGPTSSPLFGPPSAYAASGVGAGPGIPKSTPPRGEPLPGNPPPPAFSRPIVWGKDDDRLEDEDDYAPIVRGERRGPHAGMVIQAVGILGAVAALSWWAATSLHLGSNSAGNPAAAPPPSASHAAHAPGTGAGASNSAEAHPATSAPAAKSSPSGVTPVTTPPTQPPPPNAADVTALQVQLLGGSPTVHQIGMILAVNTSGTGQVTVSVDYYGTKDGKRTGERTASWTLSGKTAYSIGNSIPTDSYCGEVFTLKATSGDATSTQSTNPGC